MPQLQRLVLSARYKRTWSNSPEKLLKRGFALITDESGDSIYSVRNVTEKDKLLIQLCDGKISAEFTPPKTWVLEKDLSFTVGMDHGITEDDIDTLQEYKLYFPDFNFSKIVEKYN